LGEPLLLFGRAPGERMDDDFRHGLLFVGVLVDRSAAGD
jgi:hypothetical protein